LTPADAERPGRSFCREGRGRGAVLSARTGTVSRPARLGPARDPVPTRQRRTITGKEGNQIRFHFRVGLHIDLFEVCSVYRGRDGHYWPPPAQIRQRRCDSRRRGPHRGRNCGTPPSGSRAARRPKARFARTLTFRYCSYRSMIYSNQFCLNERKNSIFPINI
jgi:hypothetical protein